jgi:hypothetical protein
MFLGVGGLEANRLERSSHAGAALGARRSTERRQRLGDDFLDALARI